MNKGIAAITGGSGMVGREIQDKLLHDGYPVRILTRNKSLCDERVQIYVGDISDTIVLKSFLHGASYLFHCAAELRDESRMWKVNVEGTERLINLIPKTKISYFCYLSSAGVIGLTSNSLVDEESSCHPQNKYEESKWAAEKLVARGIVNCRTVILRPTDVIDDTRPGALSLPIKNRWSDRLLVSLKGNECAHIVHAADVADAAVYFINSRFEEPTVFFVSCDHEPLNTFGGLWELYKTVQQGGNTKQVTRRTYFPEIIPYLLRRVARGPCNRGYIRYSSSRLMATGFRYRLGVEGAVRRIAAAWQG